VRGSIGARRGGRLRHRIAVSDRWLEARPPVAAVVCGDLRLPRCLSRASIPTHVVACEPGDPALRVCRGPRAHLIPSPATSPAAALEALCALGDSFAARPVLACGHAPLVGLVARHRVCLQRRFRLLVPERELIEDLADPGRLAALAARHSLPLAAADGRRAGDLTYAFFAFCDRNAEPRAWFAVRELGGAGLGARVERARDPDVERLGRRACMALRLLGPVAIGLGRDRPGGRLSLTRIEARFTPWCALGAAWGVNLPLLAYDYLTAGLVARRAAPVP
jgi:hypothetical protein